MAFWRKGEESQPLGDPTSHIQRGHPNILELSLGRSLVETKGWEQGWVSTKLHFQANFELVCHSPGFQILCIFSSPCLFKARKEGRARKFYKEWKHISDSCEQLLIFLTYNFLITVNQNNLHDNIFPSPPPSVFKEP